MPISDSTEPKTFRSDACYAYVATKCHGGTLKIESKNDVQDGHKAYAVVAREVTDPNDPYGILINESFQSIEAQCGNPQNNLNTRLCLAKVRVV